MCVFLKLNILDYGVGSMNRVKERSYIMEVPTIEVATIIVGVVSAIATFLNFILGKWYEKKIELRKIKEQQYIDFL